MLTGVPAFVALILFCAACFAVGYAVARRSGLKRERELSEELASAAARYRKSIQGQSEATASEDSEAEQWKEAYETMQQSYDSMKSAYESMKQAAESYEEASNANRRAYEDMKSVNENLLETIKSHKESAAG